MPAASFDLAAVQRRIRAAVEPVVQAQADTLAADARAKAPVRTGAYRAATDTEDGYESVP